GEDVSQWNEFADSLPGYMINRDGALAEWAWPGLDDNYAHRHTSHLVGVWPYREITTDNRPLATAAKRALDFRKQFQFGNNAGHGLLMGALEYACLHDGKSCGELVRQLAATDFYYDGLASAHFGDHGVFCTDVVNTMPAIIMEMLIGSTDNTITLLPALPKSLGHGELKGILTRTGVRVESMSWSDTGIDCRLYSPRECRIEVRAPREQRELTLGADTYSELHFDI
ncbi:MAG: glycoside hydrolase family 95 protein, partial [Muribaculaceae bacterium]|nr:glycoside hydrolase family 95 protein [Muribaculaceae bacterium]